MRNVAAHILEVAKRAPGALLTPHKLVRAFRSAFALQELQSQRPRHRRLVAITAGEAGLLVRFDQAGNASTATARCQASMARIARPRTGRRACLCASP